MSASRRNSRIAGTSPSIQRASVERVAGVLADEARCSGDSVGDHVRSAAARLRDRLRAALHRCGQPALGVRERHDDLLVGASGLDDLAVVGQLVLAERDGELRDGDGDRDEAGHRLGSLRPGLQVDLREAERLLALAHRVGVVLARQAWHRAEPSGARCSPTTSPRRPSRGLPRRFRREARMPLRASPTRSRGRRCGTSSAPMQVRPACTARRSADGLSGSRSCGSGRLV